ncbi:DUF2523 family protein [Shewanella sp. HL-SH4]|uniref:DUF2523 family protein n=1 Tax=Shewanella sp. HL-SH4 TaxID=3436240 RepID=UPI003EBA03BF
MKILIFIFCLLLSSSAFAADGIEGFANSVTDFFGLVEYFFTEGIPDFVTRFTAWFVEYYMLLQAYAYLASLRFAWDVAQLILQDLSVAEAIGAAFNSLPPSLRTFAIECRIVDAINVILNAYVTKIVFRMI